MAKEFEDGGLWLPSDFLCDEFVLSGGGGKDGGGDFATACFPGEFPFGLGSNLDSPVESVIETEESDEEEEHIAGLAQQMARYFLQDEDKLASGGAADDAKAMARSPQSTLCAWSAASNKGSPNGPSLVSSPPSTSPMKEQNKDLGDLLYEAAGHVIRFRSNDLGSRESLYGRGILGAPKKPTVLSSVASENASFGYHATCAVTPVLTQQQLQAAQFPGIFCSRLVSPSEAAANDKASAVGGLRKAEQSQRRWPALGSIALRVAAAPKTATAAAAAAATTSSRVRDAGRVPPQRRLAEGVRRDRRLPAPDGWQEARAKDKDR
ncbi:hypothetical protein GW17_00038679 [Ensete ventricosum]|nr:hypothetical protein GW17_00038679 [Ensete ventricosum]